MASKHSLAKYRFWGQHPKKNVPKRQVRNLADIDEIKAEDIIICPWCYQVIDLVEDESHINSCMYNVANYDYEPWALMDDAWDSYHQSMCDIDDMESADDKYDWAKRGDINYGNWPDDADFDFGGDLW